MANAVVLWWRDETTVKRSRPDLGVDPTVDGVQVDDLHSPRDISMSPASSSVLSAR
jgi:hypothetical protein